MGKLVGSIVAGTIAGVIGAVVWGALAYWANIQSAFVAWLIGGLVGFAVCVGGGEGNFGGLLAVLIAVVAICAGKVNAVNNYLEDAEEIVDEVATGFSDYITAEKFNQLQADSKEFAKVGSRDEYAAFMVDHNYSFAMDAADVTEEELREFESKDVPVLQRFVSDTPPTLEQYRQHLDFQRSLENTKDKFFNLSLGEKLKMTMRWYDAIFFLLAIVTAYKLGFGGIRTSD